jgi:hypothetical protein
MRPDDSVGSICAPAWAATRKKKARYRCGRCLKGLVVAKIGNRCKMQACHAEVVDVIKRPDRAMLVPRRRAGARHE